MHFHDVNIPDNLVEAAFSNSLVVFAGAGVSMQSPVCLPSFDGLISKIKQAVDPAGKIRERQCESLPNGTVLYKETPEQYLSHLEAETHMVRKACSESLPATNKTNELHKNLLRLFPTPAALRIVTTNFDNCFENALEEAGRRCEVHSSPALPFGDDFEGLVHIHGTTDKQKSMVLLAEDYGKAYVTNGWAARFLVDLFSQYTVLFIGYSCGDSLIDYLTRSISVQITGRAYTLCKDSEDHSDWLARGVVPIPYNAHEDLPLIIEEWATYLEQSVSERVRTLREIASHEELAETEIEYVLQSFSWYDKDDRALFVCEFCFVSTSFEHLQLLFKHNIASFLTSTDIDDAERALLQWTVSFAINNSIEFQKLCSNIHHDLSPHFFHYLSWRLAETGATPEIIGPWIAWLESMPPHYHSHCMQALVELAGTCTEREIVFAIIRMLLHVSVSAPRDAIVGARQEAVIAVSDDYFEEQLLGSIKNHRASIGSRVFEYCLQQIELAYSIQTCCWTNPNAFDGISFSCASVDPHEQNQYSYGPGRVLLNIAREAVDSSYASQAVEKCLNSNCNIIIRLGIWLMKEFLCTGNSLKIIQEKNYLSNHCLHHETFHLIRASFAIAESSQRDEFADYLASRFNSKTDSDYSCFNICNWILEETFHDTIEKLRSTVLSRNPHFKPREHPDFTHFISGGFIDDSEKYIIERESFTASKMLSKLQNMSNSSQFTTGFDIVSTPCRDYPDIAFGMIQQLFERERSTDETRLCNLLIQALEWNSPLIPSCEARALLSNLLKEQEFCVETIKVFSRFTSPSDNSTAWSVDDLSELLESASMHATKYLNAMPALLPQDNCDWFEIGINHPVGKYMQLIASLDDASLENTGRHRELAFRLLHELDPLTLQDSVGSRAVIACYFANFNKWISIDKDYASQMSALLSDGKWSAEPAWHGIAWQKTLSFASWESTKSHWELLFKGAISLEEDRITTLTGLYTRIIISHAGECDKARMLKICSTATKTALHVACRQIDNWLNTLEIEGQKHAWNSWMSEAFSFIAVAKPENSEVLTNMYCRWIRKFPGLRSSIATALARDCSNANSTDIFIRKGTLKDISLDENLSMSEVVSIIVFLLNHQKHQLIQEDARAAAQNIDLNLLSKDETKELKDAYTRKGLLDITFGK